MFVFFSRHISLFLRTMWATAFFLGVLSLFKLFEKALRAVTLFSKPICAILLTLREPCYLVWNIKTLESVLGPPTHTHNTVKENDAFPLSPYLLNAPPSPRLLTSYRPNQKYSPVHHSLPLGQKCYRPQGLRLSS